MELLVTCLFTTNIRHSTTSHIANILLLTHMREGCVVVTYTTSRRTTNKAKMFHCALNVCFTFNHSYDVAVLLLPCEHCARANGSYWQLLNFIVFLFIYIYEQCKKLLRGDVYLNKCVCCVWYTYTYKHTYITTHRFYYK